MKFDIVLKNARVVDWELDIDEICDVGIFEGKIVEISKDISCEFAKDVYELNSKLCVAGLIDTHVHASSWLGGEVSHKMLSIAGVTTALDMSGPVDSVIELMQTHGAGLNIATVEYVRPNYTVKTQDPKNDELDTLINSVMKRGGIGIKLLGGHYPLTSDATQRAISIGVQNGAHVAFHAGTKNNGSNLNGALEAIELADGKRLHLAHINAYCRGNLKPAMQEARILLRALESNKNILSESYLCAYNGTSAQIIDNKTASLVTKTCLEKGGYDADKNGLEKAIMDGYANVNYPYGGVNILKFGKEAVDFWLSKNTCCTVSFSVNPVLPRVYIASHKRQDGEFTVDCISTDGGGIVRNVIIPMGLNLVELGAITLKEFVKKTSYNPAKMLNLKTKGSLKAGMDADITIIDYEKRVAYMSIINGKVAMLRGHIFAEKGTLIATEKAKDFLRDKKIKHIFIPEFS